MYITRTNPITNITYIYQVNDYISKLTQCSTGQFQCQDQSCILDSDVCDGYNDCPCGEDEQHCFCLTGRGNHQSGNFCHNICHSINCSRMPLYKPMASGGCISYHPYREQQTDTQKYYFCAGKKVPEMYVNDLYLDCVGSTDEEEYNLLLSSLHRIASMRCKGDIIACFPGHMRCFGIEDMCIFDLDMKGNLLFCRNGAHLQDCEDFPCSNAYKCETSYCIPYRRVCDGHTDCPHGDDETGCDNYVCMGMLRCRNASFCVHKIEVYHGVRYCPDGDDETLCELG